MNLEEVERILKTAQRCWIRFIKVDGSIRGMSCTLNPAVLKGFGETYEPRITETVLPVYDLDTRAWRSFRLDHLKKLEATYL